MDKWFDKHEAVKLKREAKKVAELETPLEKKLREATSNQNWGCPNSVLYELCVAAQDFHDRQKIMAKIQEKLGSEPHRWRRIIKTLTLLEFMMKNGSQEILPELLAEQYNVRRLKNFQYSEEGKDRGAVIREKVQKLLELMSNQDILKGAREEAQAHRQKFSGSGGGGGGGGRSSGGASASSVALSKAADAFRSAESHFGGMNSSTRNSLEERFNELKKKRDEERREAREPPRRTSTEASPASRSEEKEDRRGRDRRDDDDAGDKSYGIFDPDDTPTGALSDSDDEPAILAPPPGGKETKQQDLLDMFDEPPAAPAAAASSDWGDFVTANPPAPQSSLAPPPASTSSATSAPPGFGDLLGESATSAAAPAAAAAAPADDFFEDFQTGGGPTFTGGPVFTGSLPDSRPAPFAAPIQAAPPTLAAAPSSAMPVLGAPGSAPPATPASPAPASKPAEPAKNTDLAGTFLDDMNGLLDLNLGSGSTVQVR